jgi:hypothetical protein
VGAVKQKRSTVEREMKGKDDQSGSSLREKTEWNTYLSCACCGGEDESDAVED